MKLFQYAVIWKPTKDERDEGERAKVVVDVTTVLAKDQEGATMLAGRAIPAEYMDDPSCLDIAVRPF